MKGEPAWMRDYRLKALEIFWKKPMPSWGGDLSQIDFQDIYYYVKPTSEEAKSWEDVPADMKRTFDKLGIPEAEQKFLSGVGAQYDSEVVYHKIQEKLEKLGVIFLSCDHGLRDHEELFQRVLRHGDSVRRQQVRGAQLGGVVGGSFIYVPKGVHVDVPLQAYFRINTKDMGQFERTLIIVDEGAYVHYVEGCTAPIYSSDSLHSAVVEIIVRPGARCRYTTIQNWSNNVYNLVTKRAVAYRDATMEWVDGNLGSKLTMKYPAVYHDGAGCARRDAVDRVRRQGPAPGRGRQGDRTAAPNTTSKIVSKSISKDGGRAGYRGLVKVVKGAVDCQSTVNCDALILDEDSRSDTYPYHGDRGGPCRHRSRGHGLQDRRRAALLPAEPRHQQGRGGCDDRLGLHRAGRQGAADGVRRRDESTDPAADGRLGRMITTAAAVKGFDVDFGLRAPSAAPRSAGAALGARRRRAAAAVMKTLAYPDRLDELWRRTDFRTLEAALPDTEPGGARAPARNLDDLPAPVITALAGATSAYALLIQRDADVVLEQTHPTLERQGWW